MVLHSGFAFLLSYNSDLAVRAFAIVFSSIDLMHFSILGIKGG